MAQLFDHLIVKTDAKAFEGNTYTEAPLRLTVITPRLLRIEVSASGQFTDAPTQSFLKRNLGEVSFTHQHKGNLLCINTGKVLFAVHAQTGALQYVVLNGKKIHPNPMHNLKGTARTLDAAYGAVPLKDGVLSSDGVAILDDSNALLLKKDGTLEKRPEKQKDKYIFAYGKDYIGALQDFYRITGEVPLIPRYSLGNWWSRYKAYTQEEYIDVMRAFKAHDVPLSVATIDMDWHWVNLKDKFGKDNCTSERGGTNGWTGYSWNTDLFPDHCAFLDYLHKEKLKTSVNLHPADGIRFFEDCYEETAKAMGIDPNTKAPVPFDMTDPQFVNTYFEKVHRPLEDEGVDFWWIDWQQGTKSRLEGLDPLWLLNHYHTLDSGRSNRRPLILSRYAEIGSHRYPLGFSGDTVMSWRSLNFQPYFTVTASNCGYTWWSHDIGGHMLGVHDDELYVRWLQFGVFSPIMRLHSTSHDLFGKEPWRYSYEAEHISEDYMRLRHQLVPYLYTMNARTHKEGRALCEPLYYECPNEKGAYACKNGYKFGTELLVCPVTSKMDAHTKTAITKVYLPKGRWTNLCTGRIYTGGQTVHVSSELHENGVFLKAGAIVPLSLDKGNGVDNPKKLGLLLSRGNNSFTLYEDDGETKAYENGEVSETVFTLSENGNSLHLSISGTKEASYLPKKRSYTLFLRDVRSAENLHCTVDGKEISAKMESTDYGLTVTLPQMAITSKVEITLDGVKALENPPYTEEILRIFTKYNCTNLTKMAVYQSFKAVKSKQTALTLAYKLPHTALRAELLEVLHDMM